MNNKFGKLTAAVLLCATQIQLAWALDDSSWWIGGKIKQGVSVANDLPGQGSEVGPSNFLMQVDANWLPAERVTVKGSLWLRGDLFPEHGGDIRQQGIQDFTSAGFIDQFNFNLNERGDGSLNNPYGATGSDIRYFDDFNNEMIREMSVKYVDHDSRFSVKMGKFQRGWGQSDGLRLLDVLHAQDLRERFVLRDAEDTRIPAWMIALDLNFSRMGIAKPFEALGMQRPQLEFIVIPEVHHSQFIVNNPTPSSSASGGIFAFPFPRLIDSKSGQGLPFLGVNLSENEADNFSLDDAEFATRLKFEALGGDWTLNAFYGQQDLPVVKFTGADLVIGSALNNPAQAAAVVPLDLNTAVGAAHGPGAYLDFLRSLATAPGSVAFPLTPFGCNDVLAGQAPNCSLSLNFDLDYDYRQKMIGASFTRELREIKFGPKDVSPVLRIEASYEFDKPFNISRVVTPFGEEEVGTTSLVIDPAQSVVKRDQWSVMLGADYFLWVPFWKNQRSSILTSVQYFNIHTDDPDDLLFQAPYSAVDSKIHKNQNYFTFLWSFGLMNEQLFLEGLSIYDPDNKGSSYRQRVDFNFFGDRLRPRLEWITFSGKREQGVLGLFKQSDIVELSLTYQF